MRQDTGPEAPRPPSGGYDLGIEGYENPILIGQGGFGSVYRCDQPSFGRQVAIKVLSSPAFEEDVRRRFNRECKAIGSLSGHPNIVTVYDSGVSSFGRPYIVMELLENGSLASRIADPPVLHWSKTVAIGAKIAAALERAHSQGILHRDIKPENILMSRYEDPKLADFGISKLSDGTATRSGVITASLGHAAPELFDGATASEKSDVYSLASSLYEVLSGRPAFEKRPDESLPSFVMRIMTTEAPTLPGSIPEAVRLAIADAMRKDPTERTASAEVLSDALTDALGEHGHQSGIVAVEATLPGANAEEPAAMGTTGPAEVLRRRPEEKTVIRHRQHVLPSPTSVTKEKRPRIRMAAAIAALLILASAGGTLAFVSRDSGEKKDQRPAAAPASTPTPTPTVAESRTERVATKKPAVHFAPKTRQLWGTLRSTESRCANRREVVIRKVGSKSIYKRTRSDGKGRWQVPIGTKGGSFVASVATRRINESEELTLLCTAVSSNKIRVAKKAVPSGAASGPSPSSPPPTSGGTDPPPPSDGGPCPAGEHLDGGFCVED